MKRYRTEERAFKRVRILQKFGYWPGVLRQQDDDGAVYFVLTHNPDVWEY